MLRARTDRQTNLPTWCMTCSTLRQKKVTLRFILLLNRQTFQQPRFYWTGAQIPRKNVKVGAFIVCTYGVCAARDTNEARAAGGDTALDFVPNDSADGSALRALLQESAG